MSAASILRGGAIAALSIEVFGSVPARAAIQRVREIGFSAAGLPAWRRDLAPEAIGKSGARDLAAVLARQGLAASWLSAGRKGRFTASATLDEDVTRIRAMLELAGRVRAGAVVGTVGKVGNADSAAARNVREALAPLAAVADATGVGLALSPAFNEYALIEAISLPFAQARVGMLFDPGEALFAGDNPVDRAIAARNVIAVRASDSSAEEADLAPGEGIVAWREVLAALGSREFYGYTTVDFAPRGDSTERAAKALDLLRRFGLP